MTNIPHVTLMGHLNEIIDLLRRGQINTAEIKTMELLGLVVADQAIKNDPSQGIADERVEGSPVFLVDLVRICPGFASVEITGCNSPREAAAKALDEAGNHSFNEGGNVDYDVNGVSLMKNDSPERIHLNSSGVHVG